MYEFEKPFHGKAPEYPPYIQREPKKQLQADWNEEDFDSPRYIRNKPNVIVDINGITADESGSLTIKPNDFFGMKSISNQKLCEIVNRIFDLSSDNQCQCKMR